MRMEVQLEFCETICVALLFFKLLNTCCNSAVRVDVNNRNILSDEKCRNVYFDKLDEASRCNICGKYCDLRCSRFVFDLYIG